jgi:hypothetical protein
MFGYNDGKTRLYQYVVFTPDEIIIPIKTMLAKSEKSVLLKILGDLPQEWKDKIDSVEVAVRPF